MYRFSQVAVIFNPGSTRNAERAARGLQKALSVSLPKLAVHLMPTERPGHASDLAYQIAHEKPKSLIVSASGDGGYNEVINGALRAQAEGATPVCAVLPAGNANDHARSLQSKPLVQLIVEAEVKKLDVLQLAARSANGATSTRYAHAYVGLGLTPTVAVELNKRHLNPVNEAMIIWRTFWSLRPVMIEKDGQHLEVDSVICSTIPSMAKLLKISVSSKPDDGAFELIVIHHNRKMQLLNHLLQGVFSDLHGSSRANDYACKLLHDAPVQLDGEIMEFQAATELTVSICPGLLRTLI